jgi:hypothetical protein
VAEPPEIRYVNCGGRDLAGFVVYLDLGAHLDLMWTERSGEGIEPSNPWAARACRF